eukprot:gene18881-biopygen9984
MPEGHRVKRRTGGGPGDPRWAWAELGSDSVAQGTTVRQEWDRLWIADQVECHCTLPPQRDTTQLHSAQWAWCQLTIVVTLAWFSPQVIGSSSEGAPADLVTGGVRASRAALGTGRVHPVVLRLRLPLAKRRSGVPALIYLLHHPFHPRLTNKRDSNREQHDFPSALTSGPDLLRSHRRTPPGAGTPLRPPANRDPHHGMSGMSGINTHNVRSDPPMTNLVQPNPAGNGRPSITRYGNNPPP